MLTWFGNNFFLDVFVYAMVGRYVLIGFCYWHTEGMEMLCFIVVHIFFILLQLGLNFDQFLFQLDLFQGTPFWILDQSYIIYL